MLSSKNKGIIIIIIIIINRFSHDVAQFVSGNYQLNIITTNGNYELRVDLEDWEGNTSFAEYKIFRISDNLQKYTLNVDGYFGTAGTL